MSVNYQRLVLGPNRQRCLTEQNVMANHSAALCAFFLVAVIHGTTCEHGGGEHMMHMGTNFHLPLPSANAGFNMLKALLCACIFSAICVCGACVYACLKICHNKRMRRKAQTKEHLEQHAHQGTIIPIYSSSHVMNPTTQRMDVCPMANRRISVIPAHDVNNQPPIALDAQPLNVPILADKDNRPLSKNDYC